MRWEWILIIGFALGFVIATVETTLIAIHGRQQFLDTHQCATNEAMDEIMAVFFYCQGYYDEAQAWWNSNATSIENMMPPTMNPSDRSEALP